MADDASVFLRRRAGRPRGPLVLANPDNDSDQEAPDNRTLQRPLATSFNPPPLPSPMSHSPYSEQSTLPPALYPQMSTSYPPAVPFNHIIPDPPSNNYSARSNPSNPSLSSPSGSSSPAIESTPPPSTPGHIASPESANTIAAERQNGTYVDHVAETRQLNGGRMSMMDRIRSPFTKRQSPSPIITTSGSYTSPINHKVLLMVSADCENYTYLEITGARDSDMIKEKIFSKLQIPDDQQPFFSIYRTEIGSYATSPALSNEQLMDLCREEGDDRCTLKFLAQHSSAQVHLTRPSPPVPNHVPPVLPYHESFASPSRKAKSIKSAHETRSSTSEPFPMDPVAGYEGSVSDEPGQREREMNRNTIRPSAQQMPRNWYGMAIPASPLVPIGVREAVRDQSPVARRPQSPTHTNDIAGTLLLDRSRGMTTTPTSQTLSPSGSSYFEDGPASSYRRTHGHSASDVTAEKERMQQDLAEKQQYITRLSPRDGNNRRPDRPPKTADEGSRRQLAQEPWVVVQSPQRTERPSTADVARPTPTLTRASQRPHLPQIPSQPRGPPPVPDSGRPRNGQQVPPNWPITHAPLSGRSGSDQRQKRLSTAKSMGDLRRVGKNNSRPLMNRENNSSTGSFMNMDESRDVSSPYVPPRCTLSPTSQSIARPSPKLTPHSSSDVNQARPLPSQGQNVGPSNFLTPNVLRHIEQPVQRPRSVTDDIGASPAPPRKLPLPPGGGVGASPFQDQDDTRSPALTSPPHPYSLAPSRSGPSGALGSNVSSKVSDGSSTFRTESELSDAQTVIIGPLTRGLVGASSPDSPRRTPMEKEKNLELNNGTIDIKKSFVQMSHESPISVYDGDNEAPGKTMKPEVRDEVRDWVAAQIATSSSSEGTSRANERVVKPQDKPLPHSGLPARSIMREVSTTSSRTDRTSISDTAEEFGSEYKDDDREYYDDTGSLWKTPLKQPSRPDISVVTDKPSTSLTTRSPHHAIIPPNFPPPNFPPPLPPKQRRLPTKGNKDKSNRDSQFIKKSQSEWAYRPNPEEISERLDTFFPDHDLDKPVIDSGGSSPTAVEPAVPGFQNSSADKDKKSRHKKSIRIVASEQNKKKYERGSRSDSSTMSSIMRKRSTKLWGSKLEEVTTSQIPSVPPVPESPTAQNPKPIFKWVRGELIGKGTYGRVYLALNATTGEMIAVKQVEIPKTDADRDDKRQVSVVEALKLESETLKDLDHPNIVQYLGFEQTPDFLSIFLEYVPGGSVAGCLRKHGKFDDQITRSFTGQILDGLAYLHKNGVIHRDLKADNILVETSGICKISDFGIAKRTDDINENGEHTSMQGSIFWMAPEVVQAARKGEQHGYNGKVDIWSLGCVVLEMWAGRRPWQDIDAIAVIYELITTKGAPPVPADVKLSTDADDFRQKCFAMNPDERPSASELRQHSYLNLQPGWAFTGFK